jgi:RimJ/RimL family protein N-acetyltransferase
MDLRAPLYTKRMMLLPTALADRADLVALEQDAEVMRYLNGGVPLVAGASTDDLPYLTPRGGENGFWTARHHSTREFLGWFALLPTEEGGCAELGYRLKRDFWGQGYATEGAEALVRFGIATCGFRRIVAYTMAVNEGSRRVMEKIGLVHVRTFHLPLPPIPGSEHGEVEYAITADTLEGAPPAPS